MKTGPILKAMIISQTVVTVFLINPDEVFGMHRAFPVRDY